jgi:hypothetical protein
MKINWKFWLIQLILLFIIQIILLTSCLSTLHIRRNHKVEKYNKADHCKITPKLLGYFAHSLTHLLGNDYFERQLLWDYFKYPKKLNVLLLTYPGNDEFKRLINNDIVQEYPRHKYFSYDPDIKIDNNPSIQLLSPKIYSNKFDIIYSLFDANQIKDIHQYIKNLRKQCKKQGILFLRMLTCSSEHAKQIVYEVDNSFKQIRVGYLNYKLIMFLNWNFLPTVISEWKKCKFDWFHYGQVIIWAQA